MDRPHAADDFVTIRARLEELRREREGVKLGEGHSQREPPVAPSGAIRWPPPPTTRPERVPRSNPWTRLSSVWDL